MGSGRGSSHKTATREIAEALGKAGWRVSMSGGSHWRLCPPDRSKPPVFLPQTPSDHRGFLNSLALLRRMGADESCLTK